MNEDGSLTPEARKALGLPSEEERNAMLAAQRSEHEREHGLTKPFLQFCDSTSRPNETLIWAHQLTHAYDDQKAASIFWPIVAKEWSSNSSPCDIRQPSCAVNTLGCTIATSVAQPELFAVTEPALPLRSGVSPPAIAWLGCRRAQSPCAETALQESGALFDSRISPTAIFIDRIPGRMDF